MTDEKFLESLTPAEYLLMLKRAEESFLGFVMLMHPQWVLTPYQVELCVVLEELEKRTLTSPDGKPVRRLMVNMPPRHSKSTICTHLFPAWFMLRNGSRKVMVSAYSGDLAKDFGSKVRNYVTHPRSAQAFPKFQMDPTSRAKDVWGTTQGGAFYGVGLGGTTTGRPANLLVVDDPVKTREEAESPTIRNKVWGFYVDSLEVRKEPLTVIADDGERIEEDPIEIVILTRWHTDDLGGRLQATDDWKEGLWRHVVYPGIVDEGLPTERALWPEKFPLEELKRKQRRNPSGFAALYQQQPFVAGGEILRSSWWRYVDEMPDSFVSIVIGMDTAVKAKQINDPSVAVVIGLGRDGNYYILDVVKGRWEFPELKRQTIILNNRFRGKGLRGIYVEDKASGPMLIQELRNGSGVSIIASQLPGDKVMKARLVTPLIEGGLVHLPKDAPWLDDFVSECEQFPNSRHDDQVDALVVALEAISRMAVPLSGWDFGPMGESLNAQLKRSNDSLSEWGSIWKGWGE